VVQRRLVHLDVAAFFLLLLTPLPRSAILPSRSREDRSPPEDRVLCRPAPADLVRGLAPVRSEIDPFVLGSAFVDRIRPGGRTWGEAQKERDAEDLRVAFL